MYDVSKEIRSYAFTEDCGEKPVIAIDLDDTLFSSTPFYLTELTALTGISYALENVVVYDLPKALGIDRNLVHHVFHESQALHKVTPYLYSEGLVRCLRDGVIAHQFGLEQREYYIVFITHRGFRADGFSITVDLLRRHRILPDMLISAPLSASKLEILDELYIDRVAMMFDDRPDTIQDFLDASIPVTKVRQPWNKDIWTDYTIDLNIQHSPLENE